MVVQLVGYLAASALGLKTVVILQPIPCHPAFVVFEQRIDQLLDNQSMQSTLHESGIRSQRVLVQDSDICVAIYTMQRFLQSQVHVRVLERLRHTC